MLTVGKYQAGDYEMKESATGALGLWLGERCREEGLSLRKASAKTSLSHATIADLIKGGSPSSETIRKLSEAFSGGGDHQRQALEDKLLTLAGYRSKRKREEVNESLAMLLGKLSKFSEPELKIMGRFADFLSEEAKR